MDLDLVAICYSFLELNEVDRSIVAGIATDVANMCDNVSVISALELIFKAERYAGMRDGRYPKSEFYKNNERLPFALIVSEACSSVTYVSRQNAIRGEDDNNDRASQTVEL